MNLIERILSTLFPPKLPCLREYTGLVNEQPEDIGDGVIGHAKKKKYRDAIERYWAKSTK
jgi:hypothetical protein